MASWASERAKQMRLVTSVKVDIPEGGESEEEVPLDYVRRSKLYYQVLKGGVLKPQGIGVSW